MSNTDILSENQIVSSAIIDKYIGESARLIREMFGYARDHQVSLALAIFFPFAKLIGLKLNFHLEDIHSGKRLCICCYLLA